MEQGSIPVVVILGPTAVGKSEIAILLAETLDAEIVSADSRLLYRGMDIGTAKPTVEQRRRIPHHLIDRADPDDTWSLVRYSTAAKDALHAIHSRGRLPMLVGGTGQYLMAILEGWEPPPKPENHEFRRAMATLAEHEGPEALHHRLRAVDPQTANRIDYRNVRRVIRALEIHHITGRPPSEVRRKKPSGLLDYRVGLQLPRPQLYARIDARIDGMLEAGFTDEVRSLLETGISPQTPAMSAIGYQQIVRFLQGEISEPEAVQEMRRATRQLVRRQANWFKADDPHIHWFLAEPGVEKAILKAIRSWMQEVIAGEAEP
ncbi:MAG TPA: tRNA (adenosine(37)-N6)-dimethylallyltransferase MiaA [Anaerolineae bacterium]|nr:tRNA (adenosine(37)-N6)-dimethylallyltransferase MiaA [Anaerolineae bacterium]